MPDSNLSQTLYTTAEAYLSLGYAVIPVWGETDPARPKVAGVEWKVYQRRRPTLTEVRDWFFTSNFAGLAIVTGSISRLAVLDFDTPEGFQQFSAQYPDLVETQVVQTRRGYHIYFHLPPHLHLPSRKGQGIDLLVEGRYVVARPTIIDGCRYKLIRGGQPKTLTAFDVERIIHFFDGQNRTVALVPVPHHELIPSLADSQGIQSIDKPHAFLKTPADLCQTYREWLEKGRGRNQALFQVSLKARDAGWQAEQVIALLADMHVRQPATGAHRHETLAWRYQETRKTVQSAFSQPPRRQESPPYKDEPTLPNTVREQLFKLGETRIVRVLDGLRLKGVKPGDTFTTHQALERLKGVVGRDSVYGALKAQTPTGLSIFNHQNPSPTPSTPANAAVNSKTETNQCNIGRAKKPGISPNHRPAALYIMPTNDELCLSLGVSPSRSDPITLDDLATAKQARQAAHRELIRRRPGHYPRRWLAHRLGISCKTLDTYNSTIEGLHSRPCFWEQPIYWSNLNAVPDGIEVSGAVLVDQMGKRYPARRSIAAWLLGQGRKIVYKRQDVNYYWYGDLPAEISVKLNLHPQSSELALHQGSAKPLVRQPHTSGLSQPESSNDKIEAVTLRNKILLKKPFDLPIAPPILGKYSDAAKIASITPQKAANYRKPLRDTTQEALALRLYNTLNEGLSDPVNRISRFTARRLVKTYGQHALERALKLLAKRQNIERPVGFIITILNSERVVKIEGFSAISPQR